MRAAGKMKFWLGSDSGMCQDPQQPCLNMANLSLCDPAIMKALIIATGAVRRPKYIHQSPGTGDYPTWGQLPTGAPSIFISYVYTCVKTLGGTPK